MSPQNKIDIFKTLQELDIAAATFIVELADKAVKNNGRFILSLSGGTTPVHLYTLLSTQTFRNKMPWEKTFVFWGDERCVPLNDKENNAHLAISVLLDKVHVPHENIFRIPVDLPPEIAADEYENTLKKFFWNRIPAFDLILLGLGENGHTASLFPGSEVIREKKHWVRAVYVEEQKMFRITMTIPLINHAHNILFLVEGANKAEILKNVLTFSEPDKFPTQLIVPENGSVFWYVNSKAAALLSPSLLLQGQNKQ